MQDKLVCSSINEKTGAGFNRTPVSSYFNKREIIAMQSFLFRLEIKYIINKNLYKTICIIFFIR